MNSSGERTESWWTLILIRNSFVTPISQRTWLRFVTKHLDRFSVLFRNTVLCESGPTRWLHAKSCRKLFWDLGRLRVDLVYFPVLRSDNTECMYCNCGRWVSHKCALIGRYVYDFPQPLVDDPLNYLQSMVDKINWFVCGEVSYVVFSFPYLYQIAHVRML